MNKEKKIVSIVGLLLVPFIIIGMVVTCGAADSNKAYWVDASTGVKIEQLDLAAGQERVIRLVAEIPANKSLKAYSFMVMFEDAKLSVIEAVASPESVLPPININTGIPGSVTANCFNMTGVKGGGKIQKVSLIDCKVKAVSSESSQVSVMFSAFGSSSEDDFKPETAPLNVVTK